MRRKLQPFKNWLSEYVMRYGEPSEHTLRLAAEKQAESAEARAAALSAALDAALSDRHFYWQMYTEQAAEIARLKEAATR